LPERMSVFIFGPIEPADVAEVIEKAEDNYIEGFNRALIKIFK